jgi:hypothetical protein
MEVLFLFFKEFYLYFHLEHLSFSWLRLEIRGGTMDFGKTYRYISKKDTKNPLLKGPVG